MTDRNCLSEHSLSPGPAARSVFAQYWYVDDNTDSLVEIKNHLEVPLVLSPRVRLSTGELLEFVPLMIGPFETVRRSLRAQLSDGLLATSPEPSHGPHRWGNGSRAHSLLGNMQLHPLYPDHASAADFSAWIVVEDTVEGIAIAYPFKTSVASSNQVLEGMWWRPHATISVYYALQNPSDRALGVRLDLFRSDGTRMAVEDLELEPFGFRLLDLSEWVSRDDAEVGGVRLTPADTSGSLLARGMAVEEGRGFSASLEAHAYLGDIPTEGPCELHASTLIFGDLGALLRGVGVIVHPHLLLRNVSRTPLEVECAVAGKDSSGGESRMPLRRMTLEAGEAVHVDLELQRRDSEAGLADGIASLEIVHQGRPTDLVAEVISVDETGDFCLYDRVVNLHSYDLATLAAISFSLSEDRRTFLVVKNVTHRAQRARVLIDYRQGTECYEQVLELAARGFAVVDLAQLRAEQVPDAMNRSLPADARFGGCMIAADEPGTLIGGDPTFVLKRSAGTTGLLGEAAGLASDGFSCLAEPGGPGGGGMAPPPQGVKIYPSTPFPGKECLVSKGCGGEHRAIDVGFTGIKVGRKVFPLEAGRVTDVVRNRPHCDRPDCQPNGVIIRGRDGAYTLYYHVSAPASLKVGDDVGVGTVIGEIDLSGESTGPHLHIERHRAGFGGTFSERESSAGEDFITCNFATGCSHQ